MFDLGFDIKLVAEHALLGFSMLVIFLAYYRGRQSLRLREKLLRGQQLELAFQEQALNEHALVTVTDTDGILQDVNQRFLDTFGYKREEVIGKPHRAFYTEHDAVKSDEIKEMTANGEIWSGITQLNHASGDVVFTQCTVVPMMDENGRHIKNISLRTDVTENRQSEVQRLMTAAFDNMHTAVCVYDPKTFHICYMNDYALTEQGWTSADLGQKTIWETDYSPNPDLLGPVTKDLMVSGRSTVVLKTPRNGREYEAQLFSISASGFSPRILVIMHDISDRVLAERKRQELVSVITHELRTPLTSIKGAVGLIGAGAVGPMSVKARSLIDIAEKNSERMLILIRDLLELERINQKGFEMEMAPVNVANLVDEAITAHRGYGLELDIEFVNAGTPQDLFVSGNADRLMQVLANLMSNAAKFSEAGSNVELGAWAEDGEVTLFVRDHGPGIPEESRETLFDRFTQTRNVGNKKVDSTGLGLSIVKSLVDRHHGTIDFATETGEGTTFMVHLPMMSPKDIEAMNAAAKVA